MPGRGLVYILCFVNDFRCTFFEFIFEKVSPPKNVDFVLLKKIITLNLRTFCGLFLSIFVWISHNSLEPRYGETHQIRLIENVWFLFDINIPYIQLEIESKGKNMMIFQIWFNVSLVHRKLDQLLLLLLINSFHFSSIFFIWFWLCLRVDFACLLNWRDAEKKGSLLSLRDASR